MEYVPKPWGREYLCWNSRSTAIWALELDSQKSTSFHCHCRKNTGLIVLSGQVSVELLSAKFDLCALEKINIFQRRFHKSTSVSPQGSVMLEIESPVEKEDLVRWSDSHGRTDSRYESERKSFGKQENFLDFNECQINKVPIKKYGLEFWIGDSSSFNFTGDDENNLIVPLEGGLMHERESDLVVGPGDVLTLKVFKLLFENFAPNKNFLSLYIKKH